MASLGKHKNHATIEKHVVHVLSEGSKYTAIAQRIAETDTLGIAKIVASLLYNIHCGLLLWYAIARSSAGVNTVLIFTPILRTGMD